MKLIHGNRHPAFLFLIALMQLHIAFPQNVPENLRQKFQRKADVA